MTVGELIAELNKHDQNMQVECFDRFGEYSKMVIVKENVSIDGKHLRSLDILGDS